MAARENDYQPGDTIRGNGAEYLVTGVLGSGGMGAVYAVKDKNIGRRFVLKILHGWLAHRHDLKERFEHEARALGHLSHPGIIEIFQLNRTRDDKQMPYYLMEPLSGESLADSLRRRKQLDLFPALGIATKLLYALEHAHERGIIHRDIKPDNVFLHQGASSEPVVKLLDFGILKLVESEEDPGVFIGTPRFAAPEQLRTDRVIGPKADLYSVGVVLFQMVTGHLPFEGYGGSLEEMLHTLLVDAPPITKHGDYPAELVALVASALAKDPADRPADAFAFASALRGIRQACAPDREDPHTHATAEVIARAARGQRDPSQITSAHLAAPTAPDEDIEKLMDALRAGAQTRVPPGAPARDAVRSGLERAVTGFESTAEEVVAKSPSPTEAARARARESDARRAAVTALPRSASDGHDAGSVRYVTREAPIDGARRPPQVQHTAPMLAPKASRQHFTEPMAGRPARLSAPPEDGRTPEPQEIDKRVPPRRRERRRQGPLGAFVGRVDRIVPIKLLPWALVAGTVAVVVGIAALRTRGVDLTKTAPPAAVPVATATTPMPLASVATPALPVAPASVAVVPASPPTVVARPAASAGPMASSSASPASRVAPAAAPKKKPVSPADVGFD